MTALVDFQVIIVLLIDRVRISTLVDACDNALLCVSVVLFDRGSSHKV